MIKYSEDKKVSVIVPLYNCRKYIERCLKSIRDQTYGNLEIIVVNDGSTDGSEKAAENIAASDDRIIIKNHEKNRGLFHARITGVESSTGDYIAFVDSDDYISRDFIRTLVYEAEESSADVVVGKTVHEDENGYRYVHNLYHFYDFGTLSGKEILGKYWDQEGRCFIWHTVWNKLYARKLWEEALPVLKKQEKHLIMAEDFVFSSVLMNFANKLTSVEYGAYFYFQHSKAATGSDGGFKKFEKNIGDLKTAFDFVRQVITDEIYKTDVTEKFRRWSDLYLFFWRENIEKSSLDESQKQKLHRLLSASLKDNGTEIVDASYFYSVTTEYDDRYDKLTDSVADENICAVSFDVFDTAVLRPFCRPSDLFRVMNDRLRRSYPGEMRSFESIRTKAEAGIRNKKIQPGSSSCDEISMDDIYAEMGSISNIPENTLNELRHCEEENEIRFASARKSILNLYRVAKHCGKKVYFTTDMYLPGSVIGNILKKCGYDDYDALIVSCEENASKRSGKLYKILRERSGCDAGRILHIGDNWGTDVEKAREAGIGAAFYPSPVDCIQYNISDIRTTHSCCPYSEPSGSFVNFEKAKEFFGTRSALAVAANKLYDNPFISYNPQTEVNCSPPFLGYYALGMHLLGFVKWVTETAVDARYDTLLFVARDGYLPMRAYETIRRYYPGSPEAKYLHTSRKAGFAASVRNVNDLYALYENINEKNCTIGQFLSMLSPVLDDTAVHETEKNGFQTDRPFSGYDEFCRLIKFMGKNGFDQNKCDTFHQSLRALFNRDMIGKTACVDIGYSGRTQETLKKVTGKSIDAFYVHKNDDQCAERERNNDFRVYAYYDFTPSVTGGAREVLFSEYAPSCIGYDPKDHAKPVFEDAEENYPAKYLISEIQKSALAFIRDFTDTFGEFLRDMDMRGTDVSYPYEYFLHTLTDADSKMFDCIEFEDEMWAGKTMKLTDYWKDCIKYHKIVPFYIQSKGRAGYDGQSADMPFLQGGPEYQVYIRNGLDKKSRLSKALYWYLVDRKFFWKRLKNYRKD